MQLLHCRPISTAEFASLSLLLKNDSSERTMGDCMSVTSPFATLSSSLATFCLCELHEYVNSLYETSQSTKGVSPTNRKTGDVAEQLLLDDSTLLGGGPVHVFRPTKGHGMGLHYAVIQENSIVQKCAAVVLGTQKTTSVESVVGVILCVGVSGSPSAPLHTMTRRMRDCLRVIEELESFSDVGECQACIKSMLSTMALTDDEERMTNAMVDLESVALMSEMEGDASNEKIKSVVSPIGVVRKTKKSQGKRGSALKGDSMGTSDRDIRFTVTASSSADMARITAERVAVLSVAESESQLRKYEATGVQRRSSMSFSLGKSKVRARRRKSSNVADLEDFDCPALPNIKKKSVPALRPPGVDTVSQNNPAKTNIPSYVSPRKAALPTILAPRNDVASRRAGQRATRRWSLGVSNGHREGPEEFTQGNLPFAQLPSDFAPPREAAFSAFAVESAGNESSANGTFPALQFGGVSDERGNRNAPLNNVVVNAGDPWGMISAAPTTEFNVPQSDQALSRFATPDTRELANSNNATSPSSALSPESPRRRPSLLDEGKQYARDDAVAKLQRMLLASEQSELNGLNDDDVSVRSTRSYQNGEWMPSSTMDEQLRSAYSELDELVAKVTPAKIVEPSEDHVEPRLMINVALNEDLTCSYRQSKMSSCSIEGVVQIQVACDSRDGVPFFLLVRDPSRHIKMIQENRRFADDMTEGLLSHSPNDVGVDYKFTVSVPSADDYFPVMRYKCSAELRPVPIRVQTRVRVNENATCRVALQISSNPANEDDLTDLTIVMGVPLEVRGETLVTTPPGGVWNAAKRSVVWCVAELGNGEKFQLQAEFEMNLGASPLPSGSKPKFPVLVRCQCMYAQLSDVELEVSDIPGVYPADVAMKLARRFRLSHRERS